MEFTPNDQKPWIDRFNELRIDPEIFGLEVYYNPYIGITQKCKAVFTIWKKLPESQDIKPNTAEEIMKYGGAGRNYKKMSLSTILFTANHHHSVNFCNLDFDILWM